MLDAEKAISPGNTPIGSAADAIPCLEFGSILGPDNGVDCKYQRRKLIGKGGFGQVWLVKRVTDGLRCIAKIVSMEGFSDKERETAKLEVLCLAKTNHFAVIKCIEHFEEKDRLLIIMEFAEGGDLRRQIKSRAQKLPRKHFSETEVALTFAQICLALDHIHRRRMLHRDIKTANVFLTSYGIAKLGDFGLSRVYDGSVSGSVGITFCGTPYYQAPEMWDRSIRYSKKADVWALGCVLFEMLTLERPFQSQGLQELCTEITQRNPPPITQNYSQEMKTLVNTILTKDPKLRPSTGEILRMPFVFNYVTKLQRASHESQALDMNLKLLVDKCIEESLEPESETPVSLEGAQLCSPVKKVSRRTDGSEEIKDRYLVLHEGDLMILKDSSKDVKDVRTGKIAVAQLISVEGDAALPNRLTVRHPEGLAVFDLPSTQERDKWIEEIRNIMSKKK